LNAQTRELQMFAERNWFWSINSSHNGRGRGFWMVEDMVKIVCLILFLLP
jgi:hypothetical protein